MLIDGRKINQEIGEGLKAKIELKNIKPSLGILCVGEDKASLSFINVKKRFGERYGFAVNILNLKEDTGILEIKEHLEKLQSQNDGVIVQLPLPENLEVYTDEVLSCIKKDKDVDDLNVGNFKAPIVLALNKIMEYVETDTNDEFNFHQKVIGIVGLGQVVGLPIKTFLENNNYKIEIIEKGQHEKIKNCEVVISGVGIPDLIKSESIRPGSVLVDYGCSYVDGVATGDFDKKCFAVSSYYTPVPGCMGPLVVACLFENLLKAASN